jgi:hypothetical protein
MKKIFLWISLLFIAGCQEVVQIDLEEGTERLVVEGRIEKIKSRTSGYQRITLSTTADYFVNAETPRAKNATVFVTDEAGNVYNFTESVQEAGVYETWQLYAGVGQTYILQIEHNGDIYRASEMVAPVAPIDSIYQIFTEETLFDEAGIRVRIDFTDPADQENFYYWQQFKDGTGYLDVNPGTKFNLINSDEFFNGRTVRGKEPNNELIYEAGQTAVVRQIGLSEAEFNYMFFLLEQAGGRGLFATPPSTVRGNVENVTNPDLYPLGYFGASEVAVAELKIQ